MTPQDRTPPDSFDLLLMRVLDGEASDIERLELLALADAEPRLQAARELRERLRAAVMEQVGALPEVVAEVMAALELDDGWDPLADALRDAITDAPPLDVADLVMSALMPAPEPEPLAAEAAETEFVPRESVQEDAGPAAALSALHDGELSREARLELATSLDRQSHQALSQYAEMGRMLREAVKQQAAEAPTDLWSGVAPAIGLSDPEHVPGWEPLAVALKEAVLDFGQQTPEATVALTAAVMNSLPRPEPEVEETLEPVPEPVPLWRMLLGNPTLIVAAVAATLIAIYGVDPQGLNPQTPLPPVAETDVVASAETAIELQSFNEGEVEDIEYADDVLVQVVQLGEGAPIFLMVDEGDTEGGATL